MDPDTVRAVVLRNRTRRDDSSAAEVRAAENFRIRVEDLFVDALFGNAEFVRFARHWCEIATDQQEVGGVGGAAEKGNHGMFHVAKVDPFEAGESPPDGARAERGK